METVVIKRKLKKLIARKLIEFIPSLCLQNSKKKNVIHLTENWIQTWLRRRRCRRKRSFHIQADRKCRNLQSKNYLFSKEHHVPVVFVSSSGPEMGRFSQFSVQRSISLGMGPSSSSPSLSRRGCWPVEPEHFLDLITFTPKMETPLFSKT